MSSARSKLARDHQAERDRRVEMAARNAAHRIGHGQNRQAEGEADPEPADADIEIAGGQHGRTAAAEHQPESAEKFRVELLGHDQLFPNLYERRMVRAGCPRRGWAQPAPKSCQIGNTLVGKKVWKRSSAELQNDLADMTRAFHAGMGGGGLGERELRIHRPGRCGRPREAARPFPGAPSAMRALARSDCGRRVEPVMVSRRIITWAKLSSTLGPCRKAI